MLRPDVPTTLVIFGATGDLAKRKLYKALFSLFKHGLLSHNFKIVGVSRSELRDKDFQKFIAECLPSSAKDFLKFAVYKFGLFEDAQSYGKLGKLLFDLDKELGKCSNKLFYLAVAPKYYKIIFENLAYSGLTIPCNDGEGWTRVLVEKPFGDNIKAAKDLDTLLSKLFQEKQIFRIDHYLARETMQDILMFRFLNTIFEPAWNSEYIDRVELKILERGEVGGRGAFYDDIGALRDVGQNHMLQMLALIAMERPDEFSAEKIRAERAKVLDSLRKMEGHEVLEATIRGQYEGFRNVEGVRGDSNTETYFKIKAFIDNKRWEGVPFIMESGKGLGDDRVEINIYFKAPSNCPWPASPDGQSHENILSFRIKPKESISIKFWAKSPGLLNKIEPKNFNFYYESEEFPGTLKEAYEKVLYDCIEGEQVLFTSSAEVSAAWRFITSIFDEWERGRPKLLIYKKGTYFDI